jgi:xanthine dehydrogenase molybdenum-binding subunit
MMRNVGEFSLANIEIAHSFKDWNRLSRTFCTNVPFDDTMVNHFDFGLVGSRGTYAVGSAVIGAAEDALQKLCEKAAPILDTKPEDLATVDGMIFVKENPDRIIIMHTITGFGTYKADYSVPNFIILFVEVEVDTETGAVKARKIVTATDVGQVIDPPSLEGQLYGALGSAGLDTAVFEETVIDRNSGHMLNMNMSDYKWRTFDDLPDFENVILETLFPTHRFKAIGVGEVATSPGPGAVLMAVSNAVGKHLQDYPLTPDRILKPLAGQKGKSE